MQPQITQISQMTRIKSYQVNPRQRRRGVKSVVAFSSQSKYYMALLKPSLTVTLNLIQGLYRC